MQHDYFHKKTWFDLLTQSQGHGCVRRQNIFYHGQLKLICNITIFRKKIHLGLGPTHSVHPRGSGPGIQTKIPYVS